MRILPLFLPSLSVACHDLCLKNFEIKALFARNAWRRIDLALGDFEKAQAL